MNKKELVEKMKDAKRKARIERETEIAWQEYYRQARKTAQKPIKDRYNRGDK